MHPPNVYYVTTYIVSQKAGGHQSLNHVAKKDKQTKKTKW